MGACHRSRMRGLGMGRVVEASFARRVALAIALAIGATGLVVALVTTVLTDRIALAQEDVRLEGVAHNLVSELDGEQGRGLRDAVGEELEELAPAGIRVAVYQAGTLLAGDPDVGVVAVGECHDTPSSMRACATSLSRGRIAVAASALARSHAHRPALLLAAAIAVVISMLLGALASTSIARWIVAPLERLRAAVASVPRDGSSRELGPDEGIVEIDALRGALSATLARLGDALARSERFAADAAHELRTPLARIRTELELLQESKQSDAETFASTARAIATSERLATLVERLLVLAMPVERLAHPERVVLEELAADVSAELPTSMRERITIELAEEIVVEGDRALLATMIGNGIDNALKFSGERGRVAVRLRRDGDMAVVEIDDEGPGLDPADRERVFEPFHRSAQARASGLPGHGIGLALVAHVAALHGGHVAFVDREVGARLRIEIPASRRLIHRS